MPIAYQYTADGYYAGFAEDYGLLPNNATRTAPDVREGVIPHWNGSAWEQIEDHKGKEGYVNGEPHTIMTYGPLPEGWSDTPPPPKLEEVKAQAVEVLKAKRLAVEYAGPLVDVDGRVLRFPSTPKDETRLNSLAGIFTAVPEAEIPDWKIADDTYVTMTAALLNQVKTLGFAHIAASFSAERQKKAEIDTCKTSEEVTAWLADKLDTGWPG